MIIQCEHCAGDRFHLLTDPETGSTRPVCFNDHTAPFAEGGGMQPAGPEVRGIKENILNAIDDLVADFLFYERKEDESLRVGAIDQAVRDGSITVDEMVERFRRCVEEGLT